MLSVLEERIVMGEVVVSSSEEVMEVEESKNKAVTLAVMEEEEEEPEVGKWEKLLPSMRLRVLLVEADDSTRQIISALLRKCSYRVAAVSDGLMAWEALKSRPHNVDLILTEVELPLISGYALLNLVVEHDICKNIPVIMMSSQDTVSMVLKCMLKGAADFLIKPVRRNELRNLWQHVWRRRTLSAELVIENIPMAQEKIEGMSENNAASNCSSACATVSRNNEESNKRKSDEQDFVEFRSSNALNASNTDTASDKDMVKMDNRSVSPDNESTERSNSLVKDHPSFCGTHTGEGHASAKTSVQHEVMRQGNDSGRSEMPPGHNNENVESSNGAIDLIGKFGGYQKGTYEQPSVNNGKSKFEFAPHLELSLRRSGASSSDSKNQGVNERCGLNHSNASAFSWYNALKVSETCLPLLLPHNHNEFRDKSHKSREQLQNISEKHDGAGFGDREELATALGVGQSGHSQLAYPTPQIGMFPLSRVRLNNDGSGFGHNVSPICDSQSGVVRTWSLALGGQASPSPHPTSASVHSNLEILSNSEQNFRQSDEATNNSVDQHVYQQNNITGQRLRKSPSVAVHSTGSSQCNGFQNHNDSNMYGGSVSRNNGASSSPHRNNGSSPPVDKSITADNLKDGSQLIHCGSSEIDMYRSSQREAALQKFRLKRKDRCYEKKVRYQSRKKLAEQRPRVKGQFVRQNDPSISDAKV